MNTGKLKFRLPVILMALVLMVLAPCPFLAVTMVRKQATRLVQDTVLGLAAAGQINADISEGLSETFEAIMTRDDERRHFHFERIDAIAKETDIQLDLYKTSIYEAEDQRNFDQLLQCRDQYRQTRKRVLAAIQDSDSDAALKLFHSALIPQYGLYHNAANQVFRYNASEATSRGYSILRICQFIQISQVIVGIVIAIAGWLMPFLVLRLFDDPDLYKDLPR